MEIFDLHNDFLIEYKEDKDLYLKHAFSDGLSLCNAIIFTTLLDRRHELLNLESYKNLVNEVSKSKLIFSFEDLGFVNTLDKLNEVIDFKPFSCGLTWNKCNLLASGAYHDGGLTTWGKHCVKLLQNNKILIDTAHLNYDGFCDLVKISDMPLINTHTGFYELNKHKRNINKKQIQDIIDSNGIIGYTFVSDFIINQNVATTKIIAKQILYFCDHYNIDNLCIGTDFNGTQNLPTDLKSYKDFDILEYELRDLGFISEDINKIFYKNAFNFALKINKSNLI